MPKVAKIAEMDVAPIAQPGDNNKFSKFADRIIKLTEEKKNIAEDIKEVFKEAKNHGFDTKDFKKSLKISQEERNLESEERVNTYLEWLGAKPIYDLLS